MKRFKLLLMLTSLAVGMGTLAGCSAQAEEKVTASTVKINFPTAATTGAVYPLGSAIANLWNTELGYVRASAQASNGGVANLNLIADGEAQIGVAVTSIMYESYHGTGVFEGRPNENLRVLTGLYYNPNQVVVSEESGINSLAEIAGKRFAPASPGSTTEIEAKLHLTEAGVSYPDGIKAQFVGFTEAIDLMRNKQVDGAWIMAGVPAAAVTEMTTTAGGKLIGMDDALIEALQVDYPWYAKYTIPAGTYANQPEDVLTSAIKMTICTDARVSDEVIYDLTKTFWENIEQLAQSQNVLKGLTIEDAVTDLAGLPIHEGAAKYYREKGILE